MFEAVRKNKRIAQVILAIIIIPFAFFGMDAWFGDAPGRGEVASVGGSKISVAELEQAVREQQDRLRQSLGEQADRALLESEALRRSALEDLINRRVLALYAVDNRLVVAPQQIQEVIAGVPAFQQDGRFSLERYEAMLRSQGMSPAMFEASLGQDLRVQQIAQAVGESAVAPKAAAKRFLAAQLEEREVRELRFAPDAFTDEVKLADDAARGYYDANPDRFERPARLRAEYVAFDQAALLDQVSVTDEEVRAFYEGNPNRFGAPEKRRARHILVEVASDATEEAVAEARVKAEGLAARLRTDAGKFEEVAKAESDDAGSASAGGDLGLFGRGEMDKAFEDAAFAQKEGEIGEPVRSDFGFHVIQVTEIQPARVRPFEEVRDEIAAELRLQAAGRRFAELAEQFSNMVYEQPDSLQPAAEQFGLEIRQTDWISRGSGTVGPFVNQKLVDALFSDDAVERKHNVEAVEVERGTLVSARVLEFEPAQRLPFDEVKADIEKQLRAEEAAKLARERGEAALAALEKGEAVEGEWGAPRPLQRGNPVLAPQAMDAVFGAPAKTLPAHVGVAMPGGGYSVFKIEKLTPAALTDDDSRLQAMSGQYGRLMAQRDFNAFVAALRDRYEVQVRQAALRPQQQ